MHLQNDMRSIFLSTVMVLSVTACGIHPASPKEEPDAPQKKMSPEVEPVCNRLYNKSPRGRRISWKGAIPIRMNFDPEFPPEFVPVVVAAADTWNKAYGGTLFQILGIRKGTSLPALDRQNTIYFMRKTDTRYAALKAHFDDDRAVAITNTMVRGNRILDADMIFDGSRRVFSTSRLRVNSFDVEGIALHELGHVLGLAHNSDNPMSTMFDGVSSIGVSVRDLDPVSSQMLDCEYR